MTIPENAKKSTIVGNPPYQNDNPTKFYELFMNAEKLENNTDVVIIKPADWEKPVK